jgi:hypothetical protein
MAMHELPHGLPLTQCGHNREPAAPPSPRSGGIHGRTYCPGALTGQPSGECRNHAQITVSTLSARPPGEFGEAHPKRGWLSALYGPWPTPIFSRLHEASTVTRPNDRARLHDDLVLGRRKLSERFHRSSPRNLTAGELLAAAARSSGVIYQLQAGWACQFRNFSDGSRAIVDIYLPGDVIGLDAGLRTRPVEDVMALTSTTVAAIDGGIARPDGMSVHSALYRVVARPAATARGPPAGHDVLPRCTGTTGDDDARLLQETARSEINHWVDVQPSFDANLDRELPRADCSTRQPHAAILAGRADRQSGKAQRNDPRSRTSHEIGSERHIRELDRDLWGALLERSSRLEFSWSPCPAGSP